MFSMIFVFTACITDHGVQERFSAGVYVFYVQAVNPCHRTNYSSTNIVAGMCMFDNEENLYVFL